MSNMGVITDQEVTYFVHMKTLCLAMLYELPKTRTICLSPANTAAEATCICSTHSPNNPYVYSYCHVFISSSIYPSVLCLCTSATIHQWSNRPFDHPTSVHSSSIETVIHSSTSLSVRPSVHPSNMKSKSSIVRFRVAKTPEAPVQPIYGVVKKDKNGWLFHVIQSDNLKTHLQQLPKRAQSKHSNKYLFINF